MPPPSSSTRDPTPYGGQAGEDYFAYQNPYGEKRGRLNVLKIRRHIQSSDRVLDFGCGGGWMLRALDCAEQTGVDVNPAAHAQCRENGVEVAADLDGLSDRSFDVVFSHHCLEHVPHPLETLKSLMLHLKPGGKLLLVLPVDDWRSQRRPSPDDPNHHLYTWTPQLLWNLLRAAGYDVQEVKLLHHAWFPGWHRTVDHLPAPIFHALCAVWSRVFRSRQLIAVATRPAS